MVAGFPFLRKLIIDSPVFLALSSPGTTIYNCLILNKYLTAPLFPHL